MDSMETFLNVYILILKIEKRMKFWEFWVKTFVVISGVPQGSGLGPILFDIFVDDGACSFKYSKFSFDVDDLNIHININTIQDSKSLQNDLNNFSQWCGENHMILNVIKYHSITILICDITFSKKKVNLYNINDYDLKKTERKNIFSHSQVTLTTKNCSELWLTQINLIVQRENAKFYSLYLFF